MGKRKSKKRKNKLARPPRRKAAAPEPKWEIPELPPEFYARSDDDGELEFAKAQAGSISDSVAHDYDEVARTRSLTSSTPELRAVDELDAPVLTMAELLKADCPTGAVDISVFASISYQKFHAEVSAIRASLPSSMEQFAVYDLPDLKQRRWLTRYCIKKEAGELASWQQVILENAGYNWLRGRKPSEEREQKVKRAPLRETRELAWRQAYTALRDVCAESPDSAVAMLTLLRADDVHFNWLAQQILAIRAGKLKPVFQDLLQVLPIDLQAIIEDRSFKQWGTRFKAYEAGGLKNVARWAGLQCRAKQAGELAAWRVQVLDAAGFDWAVAVVASQATAAERMEARWRAKLDQYLALEAAHGKPLSMQLAEARPLRPWLARMREHYKKGTLRPELIAEFEAKGFAFSGADLRKERLQRKWDQQFEKLQQFKARFGHVSVPSSYQEDPELGTWLARQRERLTKGSLRGEQLARFKAIGVEPSGSGSQRKAAKVHLSVWIRIFDQIEAFLQAEYGGKMPEIGHFSAKQRTWLKRQRDKMLAGELDAWQLEKLAGIGFDPENLPEPQSKADIQVKRQADWQDRLQSLRRFIAEQGHAHIARSCPDKKLYVFVQRVRLRWRQNKLSAAEINDLNAAGFCFDPSSEPTPAWMREYEALKLYYEVNGDSQVPRTYPPNQALAEFVAQQKQRGRKGLLLAEHIRLLNELDFQWRSGPPVAKNG